MNNNTTDIRLLEEFIVGNNELEGLSAKLDEFNIFRVLRVERAEIRHSNVLAWLLNPQESHGLSDVFVRRFISTLLLDNNERFNFGLSPVKIELMNLMDVEIRREWRNIDLLIYSKENEFVVLIENKVGGKETKGQLSKYRKTALEGFPDVKPIIFVFLTMGGENPSETAQKMDYISWSYLAVYNMAKKVVEQYSNRIPEDAKIFLNHYLNVLRRETMQEKDIEELCKSIYRKHKAAIDLIVKWGATTTFGDVLEDFIKEHEGELEKFESTANDIWFIPKTWKKVMPKNIVQKWRSPYPVSLWFVQYPEIKKIGIILEIGPLTDSNIRRRLVEAFSESGFKTNKKSYTENAKYTRIYSDFHKVSDLNDFDETKKIMMKLWSDSESKRSDALKVINGFNWQKQ